MKIKEMKNNTDLKATLEIRTYLPIAEKQEVLGAILDRCLVVEDGALNYNSVLAHIMFELAMIKYHTNLEINLSSESDYDEIRKTGVDLHSYYAADYKECQVLFDAMKQELYQHYSIETAILKLIDKLSNNMGDIMSVVTQKMSDFDMSKLGVDFNQITDLLGKYGR